MNLSEGDDNSLRSESTADISLTYLQKFQNIHWAYMLSAIILSIVLYWLFYVPCTWTRRLQDVGYDLAIKKTQAKYKKDAINRIRRLRKHGDLPPPYPNGWYGIYMSQDLKPGKAVNVSCLGEHFVVFRTLKNQIYVLDAYCPHLGANMGVGGRVVGDSIECPFHQWTFRGSDGICDNVPYSACAPNGSKVRKWLANEVSGYIFVWYHADPCELPWKLPIDENIENDKLILAGYNEHYVNCHIQDIPENGADFAHFNAVHGESVLARSGEPKKSFWANFGRHQWQEPGWQPRAPPNKHLCDVKLTHTLEVTPNWHTFRLNVTGQQVGPAYVRLTLSHAIGTVIVIQTVTPVEPLVQKVVHRFYSTRILAPFAKIILSTESIMFERDIAMWNNKMYLNNPCVVKEDIKLKQFRNWYSQFYTPSSKTFAEARNTLEW